MKLHPDPSSDFADLAGSRYQRYVLYRLEESAAKSPWKFAVLWASLIVAPPLILSVNYGDITVWYFGGMTFLMVLTISDIYFSRAVLKMLRGARDCNQEHNKPSLLTPDPPPVPAVMTATTSTRHRSLASGQA